MVDMIFKSTLRNLLEILTPKPGDTNKSRWYKTSWWEKFLEYDEAMDFGLAERDVMLGDLLEWLRVAVLPFCRYWRKSALNVVLTFIAC